MSERLPLLIFGQGPVLANKADQMIKSTGIPPQKHKLAIGKWIAKNYVRAREKHWQKSGHPHAQPLEGAMNRWGTEIIIAGRELFRKKTTKRFIIMGGRTDESKKKGAESELIGRGIASAFATEVKIPLIEAEKGSSNTLENLVNICNQVLDQPSGSDEVDIMGASFHLTRMKILMKLFDINYRHVIGASDVMVYAAQTADPIDHATINELHVRHDGNVVYSDTGLKHAVSDFADKKSSAQKRAEEDLWTRILLTVPEYSLPYLARINDDDRLICILKNFDATFFPVTETNDSALQKHGIDIYADSPHVLREKLASIKRVVPDQRQRESWIAEQKYGIGWPKEVEAKLQNILYPSESDSSYKVLTYRSQPSYS